MDGNAIGERRISVEKTFVGLKNITEGDPCISKGILYNKTTGQIEVTDGCVHVWRTIRNKAVFGINAVSETQTVWIYRFLAVRCIDSYG